MDLSDSGAHEPRTENLLEMMKIMKHRRRWKQRELVPAMQPNCLRNDVSNPDVEADIVRIHHDWTNHHRKNICKKMLYRMTVDRCHGYRCLVLVMSFMNVLVNGWMVEKSVRIVDGDLAKNVEDEKFEAESG